MQIREQMSDLLAFQMKMKPFLSFSVRCNVLFIKNICSSSLWTPCAPGFLFKNSCRLTLTDLRHEVVVVPQKSFQHDVRIPWQTENILLLSRKPQSNLATWNTGGYSHWLTLLCNVPQCIFSELESVEMVKSRVRCVTVWQAAACKYGAWGRAAMYLLVKWTVTTPPWIAQMFISQ